MKLIGALTSKPYAFKARPWELENISTIDYHDANGTNILVSVRGSQIMRVLPKINTHLNDEWISDKVRFSYDGFSKQRLFHPMLKINNKFEKISWKEAFDIIKDKFDKGFLFEGIYGGACDAESILIFKELLNKIGNSTINNTHLNNNLDVDIQDNYLINSNIDESDLCLLIGTNPRFETPLLNLKIRKNVLQNKLKVFTLGYSRNLTYTTEYLGNSTRILISIIEGRHIMAQRLLTDKYPMILVGPDAFNTIKFNNTMLNLLKKMVNRENWNGFNILHQISSTIIGAELGCINKRYEKDFLNNERVIYSYNSDDIVINKNMDNFVIYQGHSADYIAQQANLILPGSAIIEKNGIIINNEGIKQKINFCTKSPADARNDWKIFEALANYLGLHLKYSNIKNIDDKLYEILPDRSKDKNFIKVNEHNATIVNGYIGSSMNNFYMTDTISRNSQTMGLAHNRFKKSEDNFI